METLREIAFNKMLAEEKKPVEKIGDVFLTEEEDNKLPKTGPKQNKLENTEVVKTRPKQEISKTIITNDGEIINNSEEKIISKETEKNKELSYQEILEKMSQELLDKPWKLREEIGQMMSNGKDWQKIPEVMDACPNVSELKKIILKLMKDYIEKKPEGYIVDIDKLKKINYYSYIKSKLPYKFNCANKRDKKNYNQAKYYNNGKKEAILFYAFNNFPLISKNDYENGDYRTKNLFYIPETAEASTDIEKIKKHPDFHLGMWEIGHDRETQDYAINGETFDSFHAKVACVIYHPHFGDGKRNEKGKLIIKNSKNQEKKIDFSFFNDYNIGGGKKANELSLRDKPYEYLKSEKGEKLVENNLLKPEDFTLSQKAKEYPYKIKKVDKNGYITIYNEEKASIRYYVGREFHKDNYQVIKINNLWGAVINKNKHYNRHLSYIFNLTHPKDEKLLITFTNKGGTIRTATKNITQTRPYKPKEIEDKKQLEELQNFEKFLEKTNEIKQISGVDILAQMETKELWENINKALLNTKKTSREIGQFVKKYGLDNLSLFLDSNISTDGFDKYINLGENLEEEVAKKIFNKFSEIVEISKQNNEELINNFFQQTPAEKINPTEEILNRGKKIVTIYSEKLVNAIVKDKQILYINLMNELDEIKKDIILFTSIFKTTFKEYGQLNFEEIKGLSFATLKSAELQENEKDEILSLSDEIYEKKPNVQSFTRKGLLNAFNNQDKTKWYILKKDNKIIATMRFDQLKSPGVVYAGSFMVRKEYEGSAIGKAMEKNIFDIEMKNNKELLAITEAKGKPVNHYIEKQGWVITGLSTNENVPFYNLSKKDLNNKYKTRQENITEKDIVKIAKKNIGVTTDTLLNEDYFAYEFKNIPDENERQQIENILKHNYTVTRFIRGKAYGDKAYLVFEKKLIKKIIN